MRQLNTFFIRTYGCQMNELDSEIMVGMLKNRGLTRVDDEGAADLLLFNTCSIRDLAERKVMGKIGQLGRLKNRKSIIGITGCMAMAKKSSLFRKLPHIDFVLGTNNITDLNVVLDEVLETGKQTIRTQEEFEENLHYLSASRDDPVKAFVSIIRGCDKYCTYCVVPYTRGKEVSRPAADIEEECRKLADRGYKEITLLGQNVNSYGKDQLQWGHRFHDLLYRLDKIEGIERIRFMTSHPCDITIELMQAIRDLPSLCEFVHFPLQAGSNRILRKMHRIYTVEQYLEKVNLFRQIVPGVSLGTDIIVGFPTETEEEFEMTCKLFRQIGYSVAFLFAYSARKGTPAFRWKDDIPETIKQERLQRLMQIYEELGKKQREEMIGETVEILVERRNRNTALAKDSIELHSKKEVGLQGRTRCWKKVILKGSDSLIGTLQKVCVSGYNHQTLLGDLTLAK